MSNEPISPDLVKQLRATTGAGMMECKKALLESGGDLAAAEVLLRKKGAKTAEKKSGREAKEGVIGSYIHAGDKVGVLVEINCETDFVARNESFRAFVKDITLQVAAATPVYVTRDEVPAAVLNVEPNAASAEAESKLEKYYSTVCLLEQVFVKDDTKVIKDLLNAKIAELGENIIIRRFTRFQVGETLAVGE